MFSEDYTAAANAAAAKAALLKKNPAGYFLLSALAGMYVGFGVLLVFTLSGAMAGSPFTKLVMGCTFGVALSLVVVAGAELFTGNNMVMAMGAMDKKIGWGEAVKLWVICWVGNLFGALVLAVLYHFTGLGTGAVGEFMASAAYTKMSLGVVPLLTRGILCNFLVCLAVWSAGRATSDAGKLIMIFWCLFAFITTGFEHSIANMTLMAVALMEPSDQAVTIGGYFWNLLFVTIGNVIGGVIFVALPYYLASRKDE